MDQGAKGMTPFPFNIEKQTEMTYYEYHKQL